jgi:hypothetical protein
MLIELPNSSEELWGTDPIMLPNTIPEAKFLGSTFYIGSKCKKCGGRIRYTNSSHCICKGWNDHRNRQDFKLGNIKKYIRFRLFSYARERAKRDNVDFNLDEEWLDNELEKTSGYCPALGIELKPGEGKATNNSYSIDRIIAKGGYTTENSALVSNLYNMMKNSAEHPLVMFEAGSFFLKGYLRLLASEDRRKYLKKTINFLTDLLERLNTEYERLTNEHD